MTLQYVYRYIGENASPCVCVRVCVCVCVHISQMDQFVLLLIEKKNKAS